MAKFIRYIPTIYNNQFLQNYILYEKHSNSPFLFREDLKYNTYY